MAQIIPVGGSIAVTIADSEVAAALMNPANNSEQNNVLIIDKAPYILSTLSFGSGGGSFASATWDALYNSGTNAIINQWPAGASVQDTSVQNGIGNFQSHLGRNGYIGSVTANLLDSNGLFLTPASGYSKTIATDSSIAIFRATGKAIVLPGTYRVVISVTDGTTTKTRTFDIVVTAYPSVPAGDGWL